MMMPRRPNRGFTLLELLIASSLVATLMVLVWSLFSTYSKLDDRAGKTATELQLVRSLMRQLQSDLDHYATPATADIQAKPDNASDIVESGNVANLDQPADLSMVSAFTGSETRLEFLARVPETFTVPGPAEFVESTFTAGTSRRTTYQVISYEWLPPPNLLDSVADTIEVASSTADTESSVIANDADIMIVGEAANATALPALNQSPPVGLFRRARSWLGAAREARARNTMAAAAAPGFGEDGMLAEPASQPMADDGMETPAIDILEPVAQDDHVPEITRLQFRYFDGVSWQTNWQGGPAGELPRAIEVRFDVDPDAAEPPDEEDLVLEPSDNETAELGELGSQDEFQDQMMIGAETLDDPDAIVTEYRFVVKLDAAVTPPPAAAEGDQ